MSWQILLIKLKDVWSWHKSQAVVQLQTGYNLVYVGGGSAWGWAENVAKGWTESWARGSAGVLVGGSAGGWDSTGDWRSEVFLLLFISVNE